MAALKKLGRRGGRHLRVITGGVPTPKRRTSARRTAIRVLAPILMIVLIALVARFIESPDVLRLRKSEPIVGTARVIDGDTLEIDGTRVRMNSIDAPELDQSCLANSAAQWSCGVTARDRLKAKIGAATVKCEPKGYDREGRTLAVCYAGSVNLNAALVTEGWAISFLIFGDRYRAEESVARRKRSGIWAGAFIAPWDWRHRNARATILGTRHVPETSRQLVLPR